MANGTDSAEKFVVFSNIRVGLKREFEFALKVQSEICGSLGRTRSRKAQSNVESGCAVLCSPEVNKLKTYESRKKRKREEQSVVKEMEVESEEEVKSDVADVNNEVEKDNEDKNDSEKMDVEEKGVLVNVEEVTVENEQRVVEEKWVLMNGEEVAVENKQRVEESNEIEKEAVPVEEEKKNGRVEVSMNLEESNCEEVDHRKSGNDLMGEENNEFEEIVVGVEYEKKNGYDNVSMNVEEDKQNEFDREKGENDLKREVNNAFEAVVGVEEDENNESDRIAMDVEEVKCEEADQGPEMAVTEVAEEKKNDIERVLVENGVLERPFEGKGSCIFAKGGSSVTEPVVTAGNDDGKAVNGVVERPFRRFTRSLLQQKVELEKESSSKEVKCEEVVQGKECGPEKVVMEVDEEKKNDTERELVENGVLERPFEGKYSSISYKGQSSVIEPVVTASDDYGKAVNGVVERPLRRFTRSLLQQKVELEKESSSKDGGIETDVTKIANGGVGAPVKLERVMKSKKVMRKFYTRLKDFLESGILEGMPVRYNRGSRVNGSGVKGLRGVVKGSGISCFCRDCKGNRVVTPTVFELHAGSSNKHPPEFIYLENGNTLRDIMNACKDSPLEILEEAVRMVVGSSSIMKSSFCLNCRGSITNAGVEELVLLCKSCAELKESQAHSAEMEPQAPSTGKGPQPPAVLGVSQAPSTELTDTSDGSPEPSSAQKSSHSKMKSSSLKSHGKITRKDLRMHKLVFEEGGLQDGTEVGYFVRGKKYLVGYKKGFGILCSCCNSEVSPSQFESHAGWATRRKPFQHIYTSNGVSLHELSIKLSLQRSFSTKENDDLCGICMDGGDLLCCDSCPRAFHIDCCSLPVVPSGTWYCRYCTNMFQREKFVEHNANARAAGRILGVDPIAQITSRCIRIVQTPDTELGGCVLCRGRDFCKSRFGRRTVILCDQCEREYHVGCLKDHGMEDLQELPKGKWLCCADCKRINSALQKLVDRGEEKLPETSLDGIKNKHQQSGSNDVVHVDVRWRVLRGKKVDASDGTRVLLSKAVSIFHDRFDPIIESASRLDLIPAMAYGRTHKGQDYHGMYCAILTVNQVVVSAGIFRIFGQELAELPLVATSNDCQGRGYFQSLFSCIEKLLSFLNVKTLVLPSASEAQAIWTNKFGFNMMTYEEQNKYRNDYPLMIFQGTAMLQKPVPKCRIIGKPVTE